jgi:hypothetical protein
MAEALLPALAPVLTRWTMGGSAAAVAPADWRGALGAEAGEAELRLLALAGQLLGALTVVEPLGDVQMLPDIPALAKPPLDPEQRPRARRLLLTLRETGQRRALLDLLDRRGWTVHPGDWMPGINENDLPEVYWPWQDWVARAGPQGMDIEEDISAETWDQFGPAARRGAFAALRRRDPTRAAAVLAAKIASETPDGRLLFLDMLAAGLSAADAPVFEALANDRAPRVKIRAAALLARLGQGDAGSEDAAELAGFFAVKIKGRLRKSLEIAAQELKTPTQRNRRTVLMDSLTFGAMSQALNLTPEELIEAWPWGGDVQADHALAAMIERSAADAVVLFAAEAMTAQGTINLHGLYPLLPRLPAAWRRRLALKVLATSGGAFMQALAIAGSDGEIDGVIATSAGQVLLSQLADRSDGKRTDHAIELLALGLLASQAAAVQALEKLAGAGLIASDPRLDMLRLNAALDSKGTKP